ncbi:hypothetical protein QQ045_006696 [Rhodiola kirilowii]
MATTTTLSSFSNIICFSGVPSSVTCQVPCRFNFSVKPPKVQAKLQGPTTRQVWRRKRLTKKDDMSEYRLERVPFLEEQVRKIREGGKILSMDIERLMMSEDNRFAFVNEVAAEATEYVENNRSEYGGAKKAVLHVLSNRLTDAGYERVEGYVETDPYKPGPSYLRETFT